MARQTPNRSAEGEADQEADREDELGLSGGLEDRYEVPAHGAREDRSSRTYGQRRADQGEQGPRVAGDGKRDGREQGESDEQDVQPPRTSIA